MNMKVPKVGLDRIIERFQQKKTVDKAGVKNYEEFLLKEKREEEMSGNQIKKDLETRN